jgi:aspartate kinase
MEGLKQVFKFGGASVKDAAGIRNMTELLKGFQETQLIIVVSAMAKTTNSLELVLKYWYEASEECRKVWKEIQNFHLDIVDELFQEKEAREEVYQSLNPIWAAMNEQLSSKPTHFARDYDKMVSFGELLSTKIISHYLNKEGLVVVWKDCRALIATDSTHRNARIEWEATERKMKEALDNTSWFITQGFIGANAEGETTTLGREGSDYTAAAICYALEYDSVTIWKDVPGIKNGDPKVFKDTVLLHQLSYEEAIELAYYGASVIHPKTIQPLQRKSIPLFVKSFIEPQNPGTHIGKDLELTPHIDCFIRKEKQWWLRVSTRDLAFIAEDQLSFIYKIFYDLGIRVNLSSHSAVSSSFCFNGEPQLQVELFKRLEKFFELELIKEAQLYTIRHSRLGSKEKIEGYRKVLHEQMSKDTFQLVVV